MEGKRGMAHTAYDSPGYTPQQNSQKYRNNYAFNQDSGVQYYRKDYVNYNQTMRFVEPPTRGTAERQLSPSPPRQPIDYSNYNQADKQKFEQLQGNKFQYSSRHPKIPESKRAQNECPPLNQPVDQMYDYEQNDIDEGQNDGGYNNYEDNEDVYYTIGDYARNESVNYESNKSAYEELNRVLEEADYVSVIDDQYSTDDGESYENYGYRGDYNPQVLNATYGEPFNPACYSGQETYQCDSEEPNHAGFSSASNIPTASQEQAYTESFHNYQQGIPQNPQSSSCPVLPNNVNQQKRKDIFKQVSKKINETVAELRNAGIEEAADQTRESNPNLEYIRRHNKNIRSIETIKGNPFQPRVPQRVVHSEKTQSQQSRNEEMQKKIQQQQLQIYRQMMQKKRLQGTENGPPSNQGSLQMHRRYSSPQRPPQRPSQQHDGINLQSMNKNENFSSHQLHQQHESPSRDGRTAMVQQFSDNRKKGDAEMPDSFVQQHAVNDLAVQDCCREAYNEYKTSFKEDTIYK